MDKNKKAIEIYDYIAEEYAKRFDAIVSDEDLKFLNIFLSHLKPGSHIVDLGCGTGFSSGYFAKKGMKTQGVDLSSNIHRQKKLFRNQFLDRRYEGIYAGRKS